MQELPPAAAAAAAAAPAAAERTSMFDSNGGDDDVDIGTNAEKFTALLPPCRQPCAVAHASFDAACCSLLPAHCLWKSACWLILCFLFQATFRHC